MRKIAIIALLVSMNAVASISHRGIEFIKNNEKCSLTAYPDASGYSIGWGHHGALKGQKISQRAADELFLEDISIVKESVDRLLGELGFKVSQGFEDGLYDLVYNCGEYGVRQSEFWARMQRCRVRNGKVDKSDLSYSIAAVKTARISHEGHKERRYKTHKMMLE